MLRYKNILPPPHILRVKTKDKCTHNDKHKYVHISPILTVSISHSDKLHAQICEKYLKKHEIFALPEKFECYHKCMIMKSSVKTKCLLQHGTLHFYSAESNIQFIKSKMDPKHGISCMSTFHNLTITPTSS